MLDIVKLARTNKKYRKMIVEWCTGRKQHYLASDCFKILKSRAEMLHDACHMKNPVNEGNVWNSKIIVSLARQNYLMRRAITKKNFIQDPLFTLDAIGNTTAENAENMQQVLTMNNYHTKYRQTFLESVIDDASMIGCFCAFTAFQPVTEYGWKTVFNPYSPYGSYQREWGPLRTDRTVGSYRFHPLNYWQMPDVANSELSPIRGFMDEYSIAELIACTESYPDSYIKETVKKVIEKGKKDSQESDDFYSPESRGFDRDYLRVHVDRVWTQLPIKGNEEDQTTYMLEMVGDELIRIDINQNDYNVIPITTGTFRKRGEFWWGHSDDEDVIPDENVLTWLLNAKSDQAIKLLDSAIFYPKGVIDIADLNNRMSNQGYVGYDPTMVKDIKSLMYPWQPTDNSTYNTDYVMREVKELAQRKTSSPDFSRGYNQGGINNKTAAAVNAQTQLFDALEGDMLTVFGNSLSLETEKKVRLLQQNLDDEFNIKPDPREEARHMQRWEVLGDFGYRTSHALQKSNLSEFTRLTNILTALTNFKGSGLPEFQNVVLGPIIRKFLKHADIEDVDEVYNPRASMEMQPGYQPSAPAASQPAMIPEGAAV